MQIISAAQAATLIDDGMTVAIGGFGAYAAPDGLLAALAQRYEVEKHPSSLTAVCTVCPGSTKRDNNGLNRLKADGLLDTVIAGHFANPPEIGRLIGENTLAAYAIPLGVVLEMLRATASHKPAVITKVGLGTFADPRIEGCKANEKTRSQNRNIVELTEIDGQEYLSYKTFPIQACLIRGTYADEDGNISVEGEAIGDFVYEMAAAVSNHGGTVIVQVEDIVSRGTLHPRAVKIHKSLVDYVVKVSDPSLHMQSYVDQYRKELAGDVRCPVGALQSMPLNNRKVIARRGALEILPDCLVNLGIGVPSGVASVANEEGIADTMTLSLESGPQGGVPVEGTGFGAAVNPEIIYDMADVFTLYDGGALDMAFLGAAEVDSAGNVNVSKFGTRCTGPGGFVNISQNSPKVFFVGTFTAEGLKEHIEDGKLVIDQEGQSKKFISSVQQVTFSGDYAKKTGQEVTYITERAVFKLTADGLLLTEIAPGVDLERDVLGQMDFTPIISPDLRTMDPRIFIDAPMGLKV